MRIRIPHTWGVGAALGLADFLLLGIPLLVIMPLGLQDDMERAIGHPLGRPYWQAYELGIPALFLYTLVWMSRVAEELGEEAEGLGVEEPHTSFLHMILWNTIGLPLLGPAVATGRLVDTLGKVERAQDASVS